MSRRLVIADVEPVCCTRKRKLENGEQRRAGIRTVHDVFANKVLEIDHDILDMPGVAVD
jgi:hypothetical protein